MIAKAVTAGILALGLGACQTVDGSSAAASGGAARGLLLAQESCSACHSVRRNGLSPNADAPTFAGIANQEGLTAETLSSWLTNAHNYPAEMQFQLDAQKVDALVAYMLTLRSADYRPPI